MFCSIWSLLLNIFSFHYLKVSGFNSEKDSSSELRVVGLGYLGDWRRRQQSSVLCGFIACFWVVNKRKWASESFLNCMGLSKALQKGNTERKETHWFDPLLLVPLTTLAIHITHLYSCMHIFIHIQIDDFQRMQASQELFWNHGKQYPPPNTWHIHPAPAWKPQDLTRHAISIF